MRRKLELKDITENASLLKDMLDQMEEDQKSGSSEETSEDVIATMKLLYDSCQKLQPTILILLGDIEDNDCLGMLPNRIVISYQNYLYLLFLFHLFVFPR